MSPPTGPIVLEDRFQIEAAIAQGGFGGVFRARDLETDAMVAVKTLLPTALADAEDRARFIREARVCLALRSPGTVRVLHVGEAELEPGQISPFVVFELIRGLPLGALVEARGTLGIAESAHVLAAALGSLSEAHQRAIVHRDIKPNNVLVVAPDQALRQPEPEGGMAARLGVPPANDEAWTDLTRLEVKVVDFGYAKVRRLDDKTVTTLTIEGETAGTVPFMSPEQILGDPNIDGRADLYSAGMLLFHLLAGQPPYLSANIPDIVRGHLADPPPALPDPWTGHPVEAVFKRAAAKKANDRYQSAEAMATALQRAAAGEDVEDSARKGLLGKLFGR